MKAIVLIILLVAINTLHGQSIDLIKTLNESIRIQRNFDEEVYSVYKVKFRESEKVIFCDYTKYLINGLREETRGEESELVDDIIIVKKKKAWYSLRSLYEFESLDLDELDTDRWATILKSYYENLRVAKSDTLTRDFIISNVVNTGVNLEDVRVLDDFKDNNERMKFIFQMFCQGLVMSQNHSQELKFVDDERFLSWYDRTYLK